MDKKPGALAIASSQAGAPAGSILGSSRSHCSSLSSLTSPPTVRSPHREKAVGTSIQGPGRPALTPFGAYISNEVTDSTLASWTQGKPNMYPSSISLLAAKGAFGGISPAHSFLSRLQFSRMWPSTLSSHATWVPLHYAPC